MSEVRPYPIKTTFISNKSMTGAFFLCLFLGIFGAHRFYAGRTGSAIFYAVVTGVGLLTSCISGYFLLVITAVLSMIDLIVIICGGFRDGSGAVLKR